MTIITLPDEVLASVGGLGYGQQRYDLADESPVTGGAFVMPMAPARWLARLSSSQNLSLAEAAAWESMVLRLRGGINRLALHDLLRPVPRGTLRGAPTLNASESIGDTTITLRNVRTEKNLLVHVNAFDDVAWTATSLSVTPNTYARPNSTAVTADTLTDSSTSVDGYVEQTATVPDDLDTYTFSVHVRKTSGGTSATVRVRLFFAGGVTSANNSVYVDTDTGAVLGGTGTCTSVDTDWWRVSVSRANNATGNTVATCRVYPAAAPHGSATITASTTGACVVWGAQLELGSAPTTLEQAPTLLRGDWLQVGSGLGTSQLVKVMDDAEAGGGGNLVVNIEPPLRLDFTAGTAVTWDRPVAYYAQRTQAQTWQVVPNGPVINGFAFDLQEQWA